MNRIQTWLTDNYQHTNGKKYVLGAVELQKRGMLHWHFLVAMEDEILIDKFRKDAENFWYRVLSQLSEKTGIDLFKRKKGDSWRNKYEEIKHRAVDVQPVYKNAAAYLAKYMSKGCKKAKNNKQKKHYTPSRWWSCSRDAMAVMHSRTVVYQLPNVDLKFIKKEVLPFIEETFINSEMWQVKLMNSYRKEHIGQIGRTNYNECLEWCQDIIPVINDMCNEYQIANDLFRRRYHSKIFKAVEERQQLELECWLYSRNNRTDKNPDFMYNEWWKQDSLQRVWYKRQGEIYEDKKWLVKRSKLVTDMLDKLFSSA